MIFHSVIDYPIYDNLIIIQYENGSYEEIFYWAMSLEKLKLIFDGSDFTGPAIRWCYSKDLDKIL